jgi:hypothetical protein
MQTEINLKKYVEMAKFLDNNYRKLGLYETLVFAQNKNKKYSFYRSFAIYDQEKKYLYDFLIDQIIPSIDLKYDSEIYNFEPLYENIRIQNLTNLKDYINRMNLELILFNEDHIIEDLHKVPMIKPYLVKKAYTISIYDIPYMKKIPNIFKQKYIKSLDISNDRVTFEDRNIYELDKGLLKNKTKILQKSIWS